MKVTTLLGEINLQEKAVDVYIDLLKKDRVSYWLRVTCTRIVCCVYLALNCHIVQGLYGYYVVWLLWIIVDGLFQLDETVSMESLLKAIRYFEVFVFNLAWSKSLLYSAIIVNRIIIVKCKACSSSRHVRACCVAALVRSASVIGGSGLCQCAQWSDTHPVGWLWQHSGGRQLLASPIAGNTLFLTCMVHALPNIMWTVACCLVRS